MNIKNLATELRNPDTIEIDNVSTLEIVKMMNQEDKKVAYCVEKKLYKIAQAIDAVSEKYSSGGRIIYCGAGTSGRLGLIDAAECPPTFGVSADDVIALMAGGSTATFKAKEGAEDDYEMCVEDLKNINFTSQDVLIGIAASGRTPYVIGGMEYANSLGAATISVTCNENCIMNELAKISIGVEVGPEVIMGSTRLKAGTAQKLVLNMISTGVMVRTGKVYSNLMVNLSTSNEKLRDRAIRIVKTIIDCKEDVIVKELERNDYNVKLTIFILLTKLERDRAIEILGQHNGHIKKSLAYVNKI